MLDKRSQVAAVTGLLELGDVARFVDRSVESCGRSAFRLVESALSEIGKPGTLAFGTLGVARLGGSISIPVELCAVFAGVANPRIRRSEGNLRLSVLLPQASPGTPKYQGNFYAR